MLTIDDIKLNIDNEDIFKNCFKEVQKFMIRKGWYGACHATTAVLYAICKFLNIEAKPCIGEVFYKVYFDHSWLVINNAIFDLAITMPFKEEYATGPIFNGLDLATGEKATLDYGVKYEGLDSQAKYAFSMPIYKYLRNSPEANLIELVIDILKLNGKYISRSRLENILGDDSWVLVE